VVTGAAWLDSLAALDLLEDVVPAEEPLVACELAAGVLVVETAGALVFELLALLDSAGSCPEASCT
jgi:hypothetical protein